MGVATDSTTVYPCYAELLTVKLPLEYLVTPRYQPVTCGHHKNVTSKAYKFVHFTCQL